MKSNKKQTSKTAQVKPAAANGAAEKEKQGATTQPPTTQSATPQQTTPPVTPAPAVQQPVTAPPASTEKEKAKETTQKKETPNKEKAPSISATVRRIIIKNPALSAAEVSQKLIDDGWDPGDVEKRTSTIATLRTDALAIIAIAKDEGCWK